MGINPTYIAGYANSITSIINSILIPTLIAVAFATFLWGIYKYFIKGADSDADRKSGRVFTLYGIIGFVVLFSVWGIVQIFMGTLNLSDATNAPAFPTIGSSGLLPNGSSCAKNTECASGLCNGEIAGICTARAGTSGGTGGTTFGGVNTGGSGTRGGGTGAPVNQALVSQTQAALVTCMQQNGNNAALCQPQYAAYTNAVSGTSSGTSSAHTPTQADTAQQATNAYNTYESCIATYTKAQCAQYLTAYTQSGGITCGTFVTSVCAPGSTCSFGFCQEPTVGDTGGSLPDGSSCTSESRAMCLGGYCNGGVCASTPGGTQGTGEGCLSDSECSSGTCDRTTNTCAGGSSNNTGTASDLQVICERSGGSYDSWAGECYCSGDYVSEGGQCVYDPVAGQASCESPNSDGVIGTWDPSANTCKWDYLNPGGSAANDTGGSLECYYDSDCPYGDVCGSDGTCVAEGW